jgi:hypothetical protein
MLARLEPAAVRVMAAPGKAATLAVATCRWPTSSTWPRNASAQAERMDKQVRASRARWRRLCRQSAGFVERERAKLAELRERRCDARADDRLGGASHA